MGDHSLTLTCRDSPIHFKFRAPSCVHPKLVIPEDWDVYIHGTTKHSIIQKDAIQFDTKTNWVLYINAMQPDLAAKLSKVAADLLTCKACGKKYGSLQSLNKHKCETAPVSEENENWVQCVNCQKWRLLPPHADIKALSEAWSCELNIYDGERNHCGAKEQTWEQAPEAESTKVVVRVIMSGQRVKPTSVHWNARAAIPSSQNATSPPPGTMVPMERYIMGAKEGGKEPETSLA
jgi:hypothetical protein